MTVAVTLDRPEIPVLLDEIADSGPDFLIRSGTLAFDTSYPNTGGTVGEILDLALALGVDEIVWVQFSTDHGYFTEYDYANDLVHVYYGDTNAVADGAFIEVPNGTNLVTASLTAVKFLAVCRVALPSEL